MHNSPSRRAVGIVTGSLSRQAGGVLPVMQAHARELSRLGYDVSVYGVSDLYTTADAAAWAPIRLSVHRPLWKKAAFAPGLGSAIAAGAHDIVHQHGIWTYPSYAVLRHSSIPKPRKVVSVHGMLEPWSLRNSSFRKKVAAYLFERSNLASAHCIHCTEHEVEGIRKFGLTNPLAVLPNGVYLPSLSRRMARPTWLPDDGKKTLLFLGRIHPKKGVAETVEAWAKVAASSPDLRDTWRLAFVGWDDGGHYENLKARAQQMPGLDVLFPGPAHGDEKTAVLEHSDAFILASHSEGLPISILEAWAHSLPVFMTRHCNLNVAFDAGAAIEIPTDPDGMVHVLKQGLRRTDIRDVGVSGRSLVASHFSWPNVGCSLGLLYRWLLGEAEKPSFVATV